MLAGQVLCQLSHTHSPLECFCVENAPRVSSRLSMIVFLSRQPQEVCDSSSPAFCLRNGTFCFGWQVGWARCLLLAFTFVYPEAGFPSPAYSFPLPCGEKGKVTPHPQHKHTEHGVFQNIRLHLFSGPFSSLAVIALVPRFSAHPHCLLACSVCVWPSSSVGIGADSTGPDARFSVHLQMGVYSIS